MKNFICHFLVFAMTALSPFALFAGNPAVKMKNFKITPINEQTIEVVHNSSKATIKMISRNKFTINGVAVTYGPSDTIETVKSRLEKAYQKSQRKSAFLEQMLIQPAHAISPGLVFGLMGGMLGFAAGRSMCPACQTAPGIVPQGAAN